MGRWIKFFITIGVGIALGLIYAWRVNPVEMVDTSPASLSIDYKTDYVLMVAEAYQVEGKLDAARSRLAELGDEPLDQIVLDAILFAEPRYQVNDVALMRALLRDLQTQPAGQNPAGMNPASTEAPGL